MWVRSQEKERLMKCEHFGFYQESKNCNIIWGNESCLWLGVYSTKEKALNVLDKIQTHLELLEYKASGREIIFQMPQDSEVE